MTKKIKSFLFKFFLKYKGATIGKNFECESFPKLTLINTKILNLKIGNNVKIVGKIEIKQRSNSSIIFENNSKIDQGVRIIVANNSKFKLGNGSRIMFYSQINCGESIYIGDNTGISSYCTITSSLHKHYKGLNYMDAEYEHKKIVIGNNVQVGTNCFIAPDSIIEDNVVVAPLSYVKGNLPSEHIYKGFPAVKVSNLYL